MQASVNNMVNAINSNSEMKTFFMKYEPPDNRGYMFSTDPEFRKFDKLLSEMVDSDGHSGSSYALCLRSAVSLLKGYKGVQG